MDITELPDGPIDRSALLELGCTDRRISRLVADGRLRRVFDGVYVPGDTDDSTEVRAAAVARVVAPYHVIVDRTAAWLHGIDVVTYPELEILPLVETCALRGNHPTERAAARGRTRDLAPRDIMTLGGLQVTTPLRTALDLGCNLERRSALAAIVRFAREHGVCAADLARELPRFKRRRGVVQLRELIPLADARIESEREAWVWDAIASVGLPLPVPQHWIEIDGVPIYRLDFAYPKSRVCVEYDGVDAHDRTDEQRARDHARRAWLRANGWTVIVVKVGDFTGDRLDRWLHELREALSPSYTNRRW